MSMNLASKSVVSAGAGMVWAASSSVAGQFVSNQADPSNQGSYLTAAIWGAAAQGASSFIQARGYATMNQAQYFAPTSFAAAMATPNARLNLSSVALGAIVGNGSSIPFGSSGGSNRK